MKRKYVVSEQFLKAQLQRLYTNSNTLDEDFIFEQKEGFVSVEALTQRGKQVLYEYENYNVIAL